jgi:hypothetical protein
MVLFGSVPCARLAVWIFLTLPTSALNVERLLESTPSLEEEVPDVFLAGDRRLAP